jgi:hypothetical protein
MVPAMVTIKPRPSNTATPRRCLRGIFSFMIIGMGKIVISKSAKQLIIPTINVDMPSSIHFPLAGKVQYAEIGLDASVQVEIQFSRRTHEH